MLPSIFAPGPLFLAAGHGIDEEDVYADVQPSTGHGRKRPLFTTGFRHVSVAWMLSGSDMALVDNWFENTLLVGTRHWTAIVANEGVGQMYWEAAWARPYQADPFATPRGVEWRVTGELILFGEGTTERPDDFTLSASYGMALTGSAAIEGSGTLSAHYGMALLGSIALSASYGMALEQVTSTFRLRETGDFRLREGGGKRRREHDDG